MRLDFTGTVSMEDFLRTRESTELVRSPGPGESVADKSPLSEAIPGMLLDLSDGDLGLFQARNSFKADTTFVSFYASAQGEGHGKKSGAHVDIGGLSITWISPQRRLAPQPEEYLTILVDSQPPPGNSGSMYGYHIGARRSSAGSGAAIDVTYAYRNAGQVYKDRGTYYTSNEYPLSSSSLGVSYAFRSVAFLRGPKDRAVIVVVDDLAMQDGAIHEYTLAAPIHSDDQVVSSGKLSGVQGDFFYTLASNRTTFMNDQPASGNGPPQWYNYNTQSKRCYVKVLQGSSERSPVTMHVRRLYGYDTLFQGYPSEIFYEPTGRYTTHFGNQVRVSVTSQAARFVTAYYPHVEGEKVPSIRWVDGEIVVKFNKRMVRTLQLSQSPFTRRRVLGLKGEWVLDP
eukprot:CAMPEP_0184681830 /NCGR_PEP_ID=MMETSP0312-20130426/4829_1 /TAXON_ID=31354 /ORGANISM="Compsopogon coeruleus, Strain SAG 36.94" /LENGTH=397 /DNA_ID=CAMNT_0027132935 /DNA_START=196 /DNA_END=1389 /DNA_ORIENTATION=+